MIPIGQSSHYDAIMDPWMALLGGLAGGGVVGASIMAILAGRARTRLLSDHTTALPQSSDGLKGASGAPVSLVQEDTP